MGKKLYINNIDLEITERCSLKCRHCFNCMQYYHNPKDIPLETIKQEMNVLVSVLDGIGEIRVLGGEPFMNRELAGIVDFLSGLPSEFNRKIIIFTNATILPTEGQLEVFSRSETSFYISDYNLDKRQRITEFCSLLEDRGIKYQVHKLNYWYKPGPVCDNHKKEGQLKELYSDCWGRDCITVLDGKLFQCEMVANANRLGLIPDFTEDYVDLTKEENLREKMDFFLNRMEYMKSCRYCNLTDEKVTPGIQEG